MGTSWMSSMFILSIHSMYRGLCLSSVWMTLWIWFQMQRWICLGESCISSSLIECFTFFLSLRLNRLHSNTWFPVNHLSNMYVLSLFLYDVVFPNCTPFGISVHNFTPFGFSVNYVCCFSVPVILWVSVLLVGTSPGLLLEILIQVLLWNLIELHLLKRDGFIVVIKILGL